MPKLNDNNVNVLTEDFLFELYNGCFNYDYVCSLVCQFMREDYLPDRIWQSLHRCLRQYHKEHKSAPTFNIMTQIASLNNDVTSLLNDIRDCAEGEDSNVIIEQFENYIKQVKFQKTYKEVGEMYASHQRDKAMKLLQEFAEWQNTFSLEQDKFVDITGTFESRYRRNQEKRQENAKKKVVSRFYIDELDEINHGRNLRGQLSCFLASTGVGKSHVARWIGRCAALQDGLHVLHIQLEGSEDEVADAYSASIVSCNSFQYETGTIDEKEFADMLEQVKAAAGTIKIKSYSKFNNKITTLDVKNDIEEYEEKYGFKPDIVIVDSEDILYDASGKEYKQEDERRRRIAVANDLKDLAGEEDLWVVTTYQATIENRDWLNDENNVLTKFNCAECKGLSRPMTHLITLNQSDNEYKENMMRLYIDKARFSKRREPFKIATDYEHERFYDRERTMNLNVVSHATRKK